MMADSTVSGAAGTTPRSTSWSRSSSRAAPWSTVIGFTIYAETEWRLTSTFQVRWVWK